MRYISRNSIDCKSIASKDPENPMLCVHQSFSQGDWEAWEDQGMEGMAVGTMVVGTMVVGTMVVAAMAVGTMVVAAMAVATMVVAAMAVGTMAVATMVVAAMAVGTMVVATMAVATMVVGTLVVDLDMDQVTFLQVIQEDLVNKVGTVQLLVVQVETPLLGLTSH